MNRLSSKQCIDTRNSTFHFSFLELSKELRKILIDKLEIIFRLPLFLFHRGITVYRRIAINLIIEDEYCRFKVKEHQ